MIAEAGWYPGEREAEVRRAGRSEHSGPWLLFSSDRTPQGFQQRSKIFGYKTS